MAEYRNPAPTVDIVIEVGDRIVMIERRNEPHGWALPGGFIDYGEPVERAAIREAEEETGLEVSLECLLYVFSDPTRDPRKHTMSSVFVAQAEGEPEGADDALRAELFGLEELPDHICFDHGRILKHYLNYRRHGELPDPVEMLAGHRSEDDASD
jgi:8-oxo-dGTP diphosphatase